MTSVSRETKDALRTYVKTLEHWQRRTNLVAPSTLDDAWNRHVVDGLQLLDHAPPEPLTWIDLGTGGGSPGLVIAIALRDRPGSHVHLVESNAKKCAFLRYVAGLTGAPVTVHDRRIERFVDDAPKADIVSARALAELTQLIEWCLPLLGAATGLFPKGADAEREIAGARKVYDLDLSLHPSVTDPAGRIVEVTGARPRVR